MLRIHITFPLNTKTVEKLQLSEDQITELDQASIYYQPKIGQKQHWKKNNNAMYIAMEETVKSFKPDVIVIGNNKIPDIILHQWGESITDQSVQPMIIRRGIELGGIPVKLANQYGIALKNIPRINSPYVARHMLQHLDFSTALPGDHVAVVGAGDIGLPIIKAAVKKELVVHVVSDALLSAEKMLTSNSARRTNKIHEIQNYLHEQGLNDDLVNYAYSVDEAFTNAKFASISVPWWLPKKQCHNRDMINKDTLTLLAPNALIVSASNPRIFTEEALYWLNEAVTRRRLKKVRIDTGHSYAAEVYERYNCHALDAQAGKAFYCDDCLLRLDRALFHTIYQHAGLSSDDLLMILPSPQDDIDIKFYVTNFSSFYNTKIESSKTQHQTNSPTCTIEKPKIANTIT